MNLCKNCNECDAIKYSQFSSGEFCSRECAMAFSTKNKRTEINKKVSITLKARVEDNKTTFKYICEKCGVNFETNKRIDKRRYKHCDCCKRNTPHIKNLADIDSIIKLSTRTIGKILKRAKVQCSMCGWNKASLDLHHITPKKDGGSNEHKNLVCLCPNCHRMAHEQLYSKAELFKVNLDKILNNWKDYYNRKDYYNQTG